MSTDRPLAGAESTTEAELDFGDREADVERALEVSQFDTEPELIEHATLAYVDELLEGSGAFPCPYDDCEETFDTYRQRRGHLGSTKHAADFPSGEFWCGYCGYGPGSFRSINVHHSQAPSHDGDPRRLDEEPDPEELPDLDVPDYKDQQLLAELYAEHDGNISELCRAHEFDVTKGTVRSWLVKYEIHDVTPHADADGSRGIVDEELVRELYDEYDGNMSAVHRELQNDADHEDIPYRTLTNRLRALSIHDPTANTRSGPRLPDVERDDDQEAVDDAETDDDSAVDHTEPTDDEPAAEQPDDVDSADENTDDEVVFPYETVDPERVTTCDPASVTSFDDLETPEWLLERSWYIALEMSATPAEFADNLGWGTEPQLATMVQLLGDDSEFEGVPADD